MSGVPRGMVIESPACASSSLSCVSFCFRCYLHQSQHSPQCSRQSGESAMPPPQAVQFRTRGPPDLQSSEWQRDALQVICFGEKEELCRPCVDCGKFTGAFCEYECSAELRLPSENWVKNQLTPHCVTCDRKFGSCHFCRQVHWAVPPSWREEAVPDQESVNFECGEIKRDKQSGRVVADLRLSQQESQ